MAVYIYICIDCDGWPKLLVSNTGFSESHHYSKSFHHVLLVVVVFVALIWFVVNYHRPLVIIAFHTLYNVYCWWCTMLWDHSPIPWLRAWEQDYLVSVPEHRNVPCNGLGSCNTL